MQLKSSQPNSDAMQISFQQLMQLAKAGDTEAQYSLSLALYDKYPEEAMKWLNLSYQRGHAKACFTKAQMTLLDYWKLDNLKQAEALYNEAYKRGFSPALEHWFKLKLLLSSEPADLTVKRFSVDHKEALADSSAFQLVGFFAGVISLEELSKETRQLVSNSHNNPSTEKNALLTQTENAAPVETINVFDNKISREQCLVFMNSVKDQLEPSEVIDPNTGRRIKHPIRSSDSTVLSIANMSLVQCYLFLRVCELVQRNWRNCEPVNILCYKHGQMYKEHHDCFAHDPLFPKEQPLNQRESTALLYLNDDFSGGDTEFPKLDIAVKPKTGRVAFFINQTDNQPDPLKTHIGRPIDSGNPKWVTTFWFRETSIIK